VRALRAERCEIAVDLQRIQKSALLARLCGAPRVLGYDRARAKELSWIWTNERVAARDPAAHMVEQYLEVARHLGVPAPRARHVLPRDPAAEEFAQARVARFGGAPILVNVGATKPANRWPPERFGLLAARLRAELDAPVLLTGGPSDREAEQAALAAAPAGHDVGTTVGATDLLQLLALQRRARLVVTCDTGPMHMAVAVGTPVVALFGPADPRRTGPWGALGPDDEELPGPHRVVRTRPHCAPCNRKTCNQPRHACLEDLTVEQVLEAVRDALAARAS
jgi:ADP-heptose:LPS heptosyltransferase